MRSPKTSGSISGSSATKSKETDMSMAKDKKDKKTSISCEIKKKIGFLNPNENKVFALVSWSGRDPKFDVRKCYVAKDGTFTLASGISLSEKEMEELVSLYGRYKESNKGVDFESIFDSSSSIMEKRRAGFRTVNGFIRLTPKKHRSIIRKDND